MNKIHNDFLIQSEPIDLVSIEIPSIAKSINPKLSYMSKPMPTYQNIIFNNWVKDCEDQILNEYHLQSTAFNGSAATLWLNEHLSKIPTNLEDADWVIKLIEDIITFFIMINSAHNEGTYSKKKIIFACTTFAKLRSSGSLMNSIIFKKLLECYDTIFNEPNIQGFEEHIGTYRDLLSKYDSIKDSVIFKKLYKVMMYAMSLSVFDKLGLSFSKMGYTHFETEALKKKYNMGPDLVHTLLDTLLFLCERGFQILKTGNFEYIFHSGDTYSGYYDQYVLLKRQSTLLTNPEAHGFKESTFRANLEDAIEKGNSIIKHNTKMSVSDRRLFSNMHNDLQFIQCDLCTKRAAREHRRAPFSVLIFGESGIGKSSIKDLLFNQYAKLKGLENDSSFCYTRNPVANFWDGFTTSQWALVLDDIASIKPSAAPTGDPSMMELIQIVNSVPFVPDQADLSNKGRTPLKCEFVMATTNVKNMNVFHYFSHPSAVQRRLPFIITPSVKAEFANDDGSLDSSKTYVIDGSYPDFWSWKVEHVQIRKIDDPHKLAETKILVETDNIIDFLKWFNKAVRTYDENQDFVEKSVNAMKEVPICNGCFLPSNSCDCQVQSWGAISGFGFRYILWAIFLNTIHFLYIVYCNTIENIVYLTIGRTAFYIMCQTQIARSMGYNVAHNIIRQRCRRIGESIQNRIGYPKILLAFVTILGSGTVLYKMCKFYMTQGMVSTQSEISVLDTSGEKPIPTGDEPENVWYKGNFELSTFELTPQITSSKGLTRDEFINIIARNCIYVEIRVDGMIYKGRFTCLKGQKYIGNNHIIPTITETAEMRIIDHTSANGVNKNFTVCLVESQIIRNFENDLLIITIPNLPPRKDITQYFTDKDLDIKTNGFYLKRADDGSVETNNLTCIKPRVWDGRAIHAAFKGDVWSATSIKPTINGDCGCLLVGETVKGYVLMGIHVLKANLTNTIGATNINRSIINKIMGKDDVYSIQASNPRLSSTSAKQELGSLHYKSVFRYIPEGTAAVYGSFVGFRPKHKSTVEITPMAPFLTNHGYKIKFGKPDMTSYKPWHIAASDMVKPIVNIREDILQMCVASFYEDIVSRLDSLDELHPYDTFTAVNGAKGVAYVDKLKANTSAGFPWKKGKKHFLNPIEPQHDLPDPVEVVEEIKENMERIIEGYHNGKRYVPVFCAHLKDEAVSFKKMKSGKTRVFTGAPMDFSIVVRKYLLSSVRLIQKNREIFEAAPGIITQSPQWTKLYKYITTHGEDRMIAGDYRAFDKTMPPSFIRAAFTILENLCQESGNYTKADLAVVRGIGQDIAFPMVDYNGDLVQFFGTNPSGHPLTVIINSLVNSLYMRYAYFYLDPEHNVHTFKDNVALMTYGDDNIMSVSKKCEWYNHTNIAAIFAQIGITYTMAEKEAKSVPFVHVSETSFLKRTWVYNEELGYYLAPLEQDSIEKSLMVWTRSKTISSQEQMIDIVSSQVREYFFYGKEVFNSKRDLLIKMTEVLELKEWIQESTFPTWDQLVIDYLDNSNTKRT